MVEERRLELLRLYQTWENELIAACPQLINDKYSHPYYLHIPDEWFDAKHRILIVGEEGFGNKQFNLPIAEAQAFNRNYLLSYNYSLTLAYNKAVPYLRVMKLADVFCSFLYYFYKLRKIHRKGNAAVF